MLADRHVSQSSAHGARRDGGTPRSVRPQGPARHGRPGGRGEAPLARRPLRSPTPAPQAGLPGDPPPGARLPLRGTRGRPRGAARACRPSRPPLPALLCGNPAHPARRSSPALTAPLAAELTAGAGEGAAERREERPASRPPRRHGRSDPLPRRTAESRRREGAALRHGRKAGGWEENCAARRALSRVGRVRGGGRPDLAAAAPRSRAFQASSKAASGGVGVRRPGTFLQGGSREIGRAHV